MTDGIDDGLLDLTSLLQVFEWDFWFPSSPNPIRDIEQDYSDTQLKIENRKKIQKILMERNDTDVCFFETHE